LSETVEKDDWQELLAGVEGELAPDREAALARLEAEAEAFRAAGPCDERGFLLLMVESDERDAAARFLAGDRSRQTVFSVFFAKAQPWLSREGGDPLSPLSSNALVGLDVAAFVAGARVLANVEPARASLALAVRRTQAFLSGWRVYRAARG